MDVFGSGGGGRVFLLLDMTREVERIVFDFSEMFFLLECATFGKPSPKRLCEMNQNTTVFESTIFFSTKCVTLRALARLECNAFVVG